MGHHRREQRKYAVNYRGHRPNGRERGGGVLVSQKMLLATHASVVGKE